MFAFIPLGIEGSEVRFPLVGAGIGVACLALFALTWLAEPNPMGVDEAATGEALAYYQAHPYLELGEPFRKRLLSRAGEETVARLKAAGGEGPGAEEAGLEQAELDALVARALQSSRETLFRRLALSTRHGLLQPGWLTHLFLHAGWMHLLGNLLFLYAVALVLEDAWGRWRFLGFYLAGGVVSGAAQWALDRGSGLVLVGASGAVSACIGAAMVRFATRRMRVGYLVLLRVGTFAVPMWLWGAVRVLGEGYDLATGASPGVAVLAHLAGLGFGAAVALGMKAAGMDRTLVGTDEADSRLVPSYGAEVGRAQEALLRGDRAEARGLLEAARARTPTDPDALWGLFGLELAEQRRPQALAHLEHLLVYLGRSGQRERAREVGHAAVEALRPDEVPPPLALLLARQVAGELERPSARRWWARAAQAPGPLRAMAALQAATLALDGEAPEEAAQVLDALAPGDVPFELQAPVAAARARVRAATGEAPAPPAPSAPVAAPGRTLLSATLLAARADGLTVQLPSGGPRTVRLQQVKAVAAGYLPDPVLRRQLVVLVLLDAGARDRPAVLLQLDQRTGGVERLRPGGAPGQASLQLAAWLAEQAGVPAFPDLERLRRGEAPTCADAAALCAAAFPGRTG